MEQVFGGNLKLFKSIDLHEIDWPNRLEDLKYLVVAILMDTQQDLLIASTLASYSTEELKDLTTIILDDDIKEYSNDEVELTYSVKTITFEFPNNFYKPQSITFITNESNKNNKKKTYNTLILVKSFPKLGNLMFQWLKNNYSIIISPLSFKSSFIVNTLNFIVEGLSDQSKLGDIELTFQVKSPLNLLSNIFVEINNNDIIQFVKQITIENDKNGSNLTLLDILNDYLETQTSIHFQKLNIIKLKCNFIIITNDGKIKFLKNVPELGRTDLINFTIWDFVYRIYETI